MKEQHIHFSCFNLLTKGGASVPDALTWAAWSERGMHIEPRTNVGKPELLDKSHIRKPSKEAKLTEFWKI